jgi:hypothetical protein
MPLLNPHLEPLPDGETLVVCEVRVDTGRQTYSHEWRFTVRLELAFVKRLIAEVGLDRAVWMLWAHFRRITTAPKIVDSERASLEDWARAVDFLLTEVKHDAEAPGEERIGA